MDKRAARARAAVRRLVGAALEPDDGASPWRQRRRARSEGSRRREEQRAGGGRRSAAAFAADTQTRRPPPQEGADAPLAATALAEGEEEASRRPPRWNAAGRARLVDREWPLARVRVGGAPTSLELGRPAFAGGSRGGAKGSSGRRVLRVELDRDGGTGAVRLGRGGAGALQQEPEVAAAAALDRVAADAAMIHRLGDGRGPGGRSDDRRPLPRGRACSGRRRSIALPRRRRRAWSPRARFRRVRRRRRRARSTRRGLQTSSARPWSRRAPQAAEAAVRASASSPMPITLWNSRGSRPRANVRPPRCHEARLRAPRATGQLAQCPCCLERRLGATQLAHSSIAAARGSTANQTRRDSSGAARRRWWWRWWRRRRRRRGRSASSRRSPQGELGGGASSGLLLGAAASASAAAAASPSTTCATTSVIAGWRRTAARGRGERCAAAARVGARCGGRYAVATSRDTHGDVLAAAAPRRAGRIGGRVPSGRAALAFVATTAAHAARPRRALPRHSAARERRGCAPWTPRLDERSATARRRRRRTGGDPLLERARARLANPRVLSELQANLKSIDLSTSDGWRRKLGFALRAVQTLGQWATGPPLPKRPTRSSMSSTTTRSAASSAPALAGLALAARGRRRALHPRELVDAVDRPRTCARRESARAVATLI